MTFRKASYVVGERVFYVTTVERRDLFVDFPRVYHETLIREITRGFERFDPARDKMAMVAHTSWPPERVHAQVVELLQLYVEPEDVDARLFATSRWRKVEIL